MNYMAHFLMVLTSPGRIPIQLQFFVASRRHLQPIFAHEKLDSCFRILSVLAAIQFFASTGHGSGTFAQSDTLELVRQLGQLGGFPR
jgi:hypothetical protein